MPPFLGQIFSPHYITKALIPVRKLSYIPCCLLGLALSALTGNAKAQWQELATVQHVAENFVREQLSGVPGRIQIAAAYPEARLKLPVCAQLRAFTPPGTRWWGNTSVGIRCEAPSTWSLYLPVTVRIYDYAVVTTRPIQRGQAITDTDVALQEIDLTALPANVLTRMEQVIGKTAKAPVGGGMALRAQWLSAPQVIVLGDRVDLSYSGAGFQILSTGRALGAGGLGEPVEVKSVSGKILKGIVREKGLVWVK